MLHNSKRPRDRVLFSGLSTSELDATLNVLRKLIAASGETWLPTDQWRTALVAAGLHEPMASAAIQDLRLRGRVTFKDVSQRSAVMVRLGLA